MEDDADDDVRGGMEAAVGASAEPARLAQLIALGEAPWTGCHTAPLPLLVRGC